MQRSFSFRGCAIVEEYLHGGTELWAAGLGFGPDFRLIYTDTEKMGVDIYQALWKSSSYWNLTLPLEEMEKRYPGLMDFVQRAVDAIEPPDCGLWTMQLYYGPEIGFVLVEAAFRMPGPNYVPMWLQNTGLNPEVLHIGAAIGLDWRVKSHKREYACAWKLTTHRLPTLLAELAVFL